MLRVRPRGLGGLPVVPGAAVQPQRLLGVQIQRAGQAVPAGATAGRVNANREGETNIEPIKPGTLLPDSQAYDAQQAIVAEYRRAKRLYAPMHSAHEGYAVLLEEVNELWEQVRLKNRDPEKMRREAVQVGAMALRFVVDVCGEVKA